MRAAAAASISIAFVATGCVWRLYEPGPCGDIVVWFSAGASGEPGADPAAMRTTLGASLTDCTDRCPCDDAIVSVGRVGALVTLAGEPVLLRGEQIGYGDSYAVRVDFGDQLLEAVVPAPPPFAVAIAPDPPARSQPAQLTWPAGSEAVVYVYVWGPNGTAYSTNSEADDGVQDLPAATFGGVGQYDISVTKVLRTSADRAMGSLGFEALVKRSVP